MSARWILPAAVAGWFAIGVALLVWVPQDRANDPERSSLLYGEQRTSFSSAEGGVLALYRLLERSGFDVQRATGSVLPDGGVLFVLGPSTWFHEDEAQRLIGWVRGGGHVVYSPPRLVGSYEEDGIVHEVQVPDPVLARLDSLDVRSDLGVRGGRLGAGRIVILSGGAWRISNRAVFERGLVEQLGWLRYITEGKGVVVFDEARAGAMLSGGLLTVLSSSRFVWPLVVLILAGGLAMWSAVYRRYPRVASHSAVGFDDSVHIDALARALEADQRESIARRAILAGVADPGRAPDGLIEAAQWAQEQS
ncbi:MAG: DUF4350 domain-containing protein [Myxococcota bacterium]